MAASFPDSDCDASFESCTSTTPLSSSGHHVYASDTFSNLSCSSSNLSSSSSSTDTSGSSTRRSSWERSVSVGSNSKPHKAHDTAWTAIRGLRLREGSVGISHFKLLRRIGQGDIGCVYLSQLRGTPCIFAMKVMDKDALGCRNKVQRMHTEREILEFVDHPFLPTLYAHFDTEQFSCLVMEFCPGGDLHALRQRQPGKRFGLKAAR